MEKKANVKKALVITGGYCDTEGLGHPDAGDYDLVIAADSGLDTAEKLGIQADIIVGDFDSLGRVPGDRVTEKEAQVIQLPCEKDVTDTMFACSCAAERGCREITILGGTGGRADHTLSNVFYLESLRERGIRAEIADGRNRIRLAVDETVTITNDGGYFSVFALDSCIVSARGCKYPTRELRLLRKEPFAVSNEVKGKRAYVKVEGKAVLITSKK